MLIWRGWGLSVLLLFFVWMIAAMVALKDANVAYFTAMPDIIALQWIFGIACILDAASIFLLARYRQSHPKAIADPNTGATMLVARVDDFFYLRLEWWTYLLLGLAAVLIGASLAGIQLFSV
jgi:hypothetical protein